ncbi:MAG TPA: peptidase MA family metallohydrolase [Anaerolineales bacterium]|nr:peptidase MA family metallohydrolase [Anaerolineales bacterium]
MSRKAPTRILLLACLPMMASALLTAAMMAAPVYAALSFQQVEFENQEPVYTFGEQMLFTGVIHSSLPVIEAQLFMQGTGLPDTIVLPVEIDAQGNTSATLDLSLSPFRAFSELHYWYRAVLQDGLTLTSPQYTLLYADNRYAWQQLQDDQFTVHWYAGEVSFAQEVLNVANTGALNWRNFLNIPPPGRTEIYVYDSVVAMQSALQTPAQEWVAGHADPDLGAALVSLPPGPEQHLEMERQIPHELMHISVYYALGPAYTNLPAWLNEGLASMAELYPNPDYPGLLENAYRSGGLLPFSSLCRSYPAETDQALVAYAQSASLTRYIFDQYGPGAIEEMLAYLLQGKDCQEVVEAALGSSLVQLENRWRQDTFTEQAWRGALANLLPWAVVLILVLGGPVLLMLGMIRRKPAGMEA